MLFDPDKKTRRDTDTEVTASDSSTAKRKCRDRMIVQQNRGEVVQLDGVIRNKSGRSYKCVFIREVQDEDIDE